MKILILTQQENYSIPYMLDILFKEIKASDQIVAAFILDNIPAGIKRGSKFNQSRDIFNTFGIARLLHYQFLDWKLQLKGNDYTVKGQFKKHNVPLITLKESVNSKSSLEQIRSFQPDLIVSIGTYQIFKESLMKTPRIGILNYHEALLPNYKGVLPAFWVLKNNELETGVSLFLVDEGVDTGRIVVQKRFLIPKGISHLGLLKQLKILGGHALLEAVEKLKTDPIDQFPIQKGEGSYCKWPTRKDILEFEDEGKSLF